MLDFIYLYPTEQLFDLQYIEGYLLSQQFTFRDPRDADTFLMCGNKDAEVFAFERRKQGAEFPYVCLISLDPKQISIRQICEIDSLVQARSFVEWITQHYHCSILDDNGNDWTEACKYSVGILYRGFNLD